MANLTARVLAQTIHLYTCQLQEAMSDPSHRPICGRKPSKNGLEGSGLRGEGAARRGALRFHEVVTGKLGGYVERRRVQLLWQPFRTTSRQIAATTVNREINIHAWLYSLSS